MSSEQVFDDPGKARPKPSQEAAGPQMEQGTTASTPLTKADIEGKLDPQKIKRMQQTMGNAAVQRFLAQRSAEGAFEVDDETASAIRDKKGSGEPLDEGVAKKAGNVLGQDFSHVNVHTDSKADSLSRQVGAKAFTTGSDIFFKEGAYAPKSDEGQKLISHELTHVVQQGEGVPSVQGKMTVNDPNDQYEAEADKVADTVMSQPDDAVQRATPIDLPDEEKATQTKRDEAVQRAAEEEQMMEMRDETVQREGEEEEEAIPPVQSKRDDAVQRAVEEEQMMEMRDDTVQRSAAPKEELAAKRDDALQRVFDIEENKEEVQEKRDDAVQRDEISEGEEGEEVAALKRDDALQLQGNIGADEKEDLL